MRARASGRDVPHGADVYDAGGSPRPGFDFSSTVVTLGPPRGWERRAAAALQSLTRYPQPHGRGLDAFLERSLGLAPASVLVANGASEALEWCARLARGRRARLVAPCFGEYRAKLERADAAVEEVWWEDAAVPDLDAWVRGLARGDQLWLANPSNPLGRVLPPPALDRLQALCAGRGVLLVLDEALLAQRLDKDSDPARYPGSKDNPCLAVVRSLGKGLGLPGLRLGYLAAAPALAARLRRFQDPWSVNAMAQHMGAWAFTEEARVARGRRLLLARRTRDLLARLAIPAGRLRPEHPGRTGYFCVHLGAPLAGPLTARLAERGFFVRDCSSYGGWGRSRLRLNPRGSAENRALAGAFAAELGAG
jgi:threonine-phosphate decarboxylase